MTDELEQRELEYEAYLRAKYSADDKTTMLAKGHALKNAAGKPSYPIGDAEDLAKAIKAVGRGGSSHDAIRKHIIKNAKRLGLSSKIPDNWNSDGSLKVTNNSARTAAFTAEQRAAALDTELRGDMTFSDTQDAVKTAIVDALGDAFDPQEDYLYVQDMTDEYAVYSCGYDGQLFQVNYSCSDDGCTVDLAGQFEVQRVTSYAKVPGGDTGAPADAGPQVVAADGNDSKPLFQSNSADATAHEHREKIPAVPKRSVWSNPTEWSWPVAYGLKVQPRAAEHEGDVSTSADFTGYASTTASRGEEGYKVSDFLGTYVERMNPGSFTKTLREQTAVPLLFNHAGIPLASTGSGTSVLCEDKSGLRNDASLDLRSSLTNDICLSMSRGDLDKMSFSFAAVKQVWSADYEERDVTEARLYDTSIVTFPANPATTAGLRSAMIEGMGREGMGLWHSMLGSVRAVRSAGGIVLNAEDPELFDRVFQALRTADEASCKQFGAYGRARTFIVGDALHQARAGAAISTANMALLQQTLTAIHNADDSLTTVNAALVGIDKALDEGEQVLSKIIGVANPDDDEGDPNDPSTESGKTPNNSGVNGDAGGGATTSGQGNPISPSDGAGARSNTIALKARGQMLADELLR